MENYKRRVELKLISLESQKENTMQDLRTSQKHISNYKYLYEKLEFLNHTIEELKTLLY